MLIASNQSLAEFNLIKEPEFISAKERLCEMYIDADKLYKSVAEKVNTLSKYHYFTFNIFMYLYPGLREYSFCMLNKFLQLVEPPIFSVIECH